MPTIIVSKEDLKRFFNRIEDIEEKLELVKGEIKEITQDEIKIEINDTNRPDLLCIEGIARQIKGLHYTDFFSQKSNIKIVVDPTLQAIRPYIGGFLVNDINIDDLCLQSLIATQERICEIFGRKRKFVAIGMYDASKITFPIFYRAAKPEKTMFVPLGMEKEMNLIDILKYHPKGQEYGYILEGKELFPFLEDSDEHCLSFPPIINSADTGKVEPGMSRIFCEVTGIDLLPVILTINILAFNFYDRGGKITPCIVEYPYTTLYGNKVITPYNFNIKMKVEKEMVNRLLGTDLTEKEIKDRLYSMCYEVNDNLEVTIPAYRKDIMHPVDLIEDIAIAIGYNSFETSPLTEWTVGGSNELQNLIKKVKEIMIGSGFEEILTNVLTNKNLCINPAIEIENKFSENYAYLRDSIIPSLLNVESCSTKAIYPHKLFEIGEVVLRDANSENCSKTKYNLCVIITHSKANFSELQSYLNVLSYYLSFDYKLNKIEHNWFIKGRVAEILFSDNKIGLIGEISPEKLEIFGIKMPCVAMELTLSDFLHLGVI